MRRGCRGLSRGQKCAGWGIKRLWGAAEEGLKGRNGGVAGVKSGGALPDPVRGQNPHLGRGEQ